MVSSLEQCLPGAGITNDRLPVIQQFITGFHHQPEAFRFRQHRDPKRREFVDMRLGKVEDFARIQVGLLAHVWGQNPGGIGGGVDQHGPQIMPFGQIGGVKAAE